MRTEVAPASKIARVEKPNNFADALSAAFSARRFMVQAAANEIRKLYRRWQMTAAGLAHRSSVRQCRSETAAIGAICSIRRARRVCGVELLVFPARRPQQTRWPRAGDGVRPHQSSATSQKKCGARCQCPTSPCSLLPERLSLRLVASNMPLTAAFCLDSLVNSDLFNQLFRKKDFVTNVRACCYR